MALHLTYSASPSVPVEVEGITPDSVAQLVLDEIRRQQVFVGNTKAELGELFQVAGNPNEQVIHWHGDLSGVHWIGAKMGSGQVHIHGAAGRHVGSEMSGGSIVVHGDAGDWVGAEMRSGFIHVHGDAGHLVGAAYRGSRRGMLGGTILIDGSVGNELGHTMRRGLIVIGKDAGDLIGFNMLAGTIVVMGQVGIRHGAGMKRGTIALLTGQRPELLPSFQFACALEPLAMTLVFREIERRGMKIPHDVRSLTLRLYNGDMIEGGRGEILLRA